MAARVPARRREAELRFGHPYAVVAVTTDPGAGDAAGAGAGQRSLWHGLPVFCAWVSQPEDATDARASGETAPGERT
jgi:hypothetical protein